MLPNLNSNVEDWINQCERNDIQSQHPISIQLSDILDGIPFHQVRSLSSFWEEEPVGSILQHSIDFATSAHVYQNYLTFVVQSTVCGIRIFYSLKESQSLLDTLGSTFPGIVLDNNPIQNLADQLAENQNQMGMLSGIPSLKTSFGIPSHIQSQSWPMIPTMLERVIRGLQGKNWIFIVQAYARPAEELIDERKEILEILANILPMKHSQLQKSIQQTQQDANRATITSSEMLGGEIINRQAEYAARIYERQLDRVDAFMRTGRWQTSIYFGAPDQAAAENLAALLRGVYSGKDSWPERLQVHMCRPNGERPEKFQTYLSSDELALLCKPPIEEAPGYEIRDYSVFDIEKEVETGPRLDLGQIKWNEKQSGNIYSVAIGQLSKHGIVAGVTGSGKTTTILNLLYQLRRQPSPIPFMVIEPVKREYRSLLGEIDSTYLHAQGPVPDLRVYTLGSDVISPFRINPFEFDVGSQPGNTALLNHIDFLKAVFNAAFILYTPMPYILEIALYEVYEDKGWNLATESNPLIGDEEWEARNHYPIFPTLTDLYEKVGEVTSRLGYESKVEQDVTAGLKARIGALRIGAKGLMLDTPRGIPFEKLLNHPVVLELENIGNDEEKTFIIGLVFARIYGYRRMQVAEGKLPKDFQHLLVVEEAHRLLKNTNTQVDTESSNLHAQATDVFMSMLAEIRFYNQGVLAAEQIPGKITPDVIKNTNLKIVHKLLAQDDRQTLGFSMNMSDAQIKRMATLKPGEAIVFSEGDDHPLLIQVEDFHRNQRLQAPSSNEVAQLANQFIDLGSYSKVPDFQKYGLSATRLNRPDAMVLDSCQKILSGLLPPDFWASVLLRAAQAPAGLSRLLKELNLKVATESTHLDAKQKQEVFLATIIFGISGALEERRKERNWRYSISDNLRSQLTECLIGLGPREEQNEYPESLKIFRESYLANLEKESGPFLVCRKCRNSCLFYAEVRRLTKRKMVLEFRELFLDSESNSRGRESLTAANYVRNQVIRWLGSENDSVNPAAYCCFANLLNLAGLEEYRQTSLAGRIGDHFLQF